eukprot:3045379-Rhodomonas_salina.1
MEHVGGHVQRFMLRVTSAVVCPKQYCSSTRYVMVMGRGTEGARGWSRAALHAPRGRTEGDPVALVQQEPRQVQGTVLAYAPMQCSYAIFA